MTLPFLAPAVAGRGCAFRRRAARTHLRKLPRRGVTRIDVIVVGLILLVSAALMIPMLSTSYDGGGRVGYCRNNLVNVAKALFLYSNRSNGRYPGYQNVLLTTDGALYVDPETDKPTPVSWAVEILTDLDRGPLYDQWRRPRTANAAPVTNSTAVLADPKIYIEIFTCPSDLSAKKQGTPLSYVANAGLPDAPLALTVPDKKSAAGEIIPGIPRDWPSSGMFFDCYTSDKRVMKDDARRPPQVVMRMKSIGRPKDRVILITENVDAGDYVLSADRDAAHDWRRAEIALGATWNADVVEADGMTLRKRPPDSALHPNDSTGRGTGDDYRYARPSSHHPGGFNVAFVGQNVQFMHDTISYYVYAKLMTTADDGVMLPGMRTPVAESFRKLQLTDEELNP